MVPKGWSHTTFEKHIDCLTGYAFSSTEYSAEEHDIRLLRGDNIEPGKLRWINAKRWPRNVQENMDKYFLLEGDFVIALDRTWISGGLKVAEVTCDDLPCLLVQRVARIRAKKTLAQGLLRQYFSGYKFERYVKLTQTATAVPHISPNDIKQFSLLLPPIAEQKKIAQILSTWDKAISVTEKLLANSQQQKKALMQQLLTGNKRLLDENGVRFSGEWKITKLIQMGKVVSGGTPDTNMAMYWEGDILWLTPTDVTALTGRFVSNTSRKITPAGLLNSSAVLLPKGSLMVCTRATIGALAISTSEICTNQGFKNIIPNEGFNIEFIYYLLQMNTNEMIKKSSGSTFLELSKKDFETLSFSCPFIKEQQKIAAVLSAADTEISTLEKKLACLKDEKKALMQQLLTGKRRVKVDEAVAV
ncbi:restriction endonuclease subunit S [Cronobacter sakazakii]|nr:restriction endonuclease subunit S [Cronobacter sakazakii]EGT4365516.1 restriction endonuclease subunit S [Cronobacter sakazakii]